MGEGEEPRQAKMGGLIAAKIVCCGALLLWAAGGLGGLGVWLGERFADGGATVAAILAPVLVLGVVVGRRLIRRRRAD